MVPMVYILIKKIKRSESVWSMQNYVGGQGGLVDLLELRWGMVHVFIYGMLFDVGIKNHWRLFFNEVNYLSQIFLHILDTGKIDKYVMVLCLILIC